MANQMLLWCGVDDALVCIGYINLIALCVLEGFVDEPGVPVQLVASIQMPWQIIVPLDARC